MKASRLTLVGVVFSFALFLFGCGASFEIKIPRSIINDQVQKQFPTVRHQGLMTVKITDPVLDFEGSKNRLGLTAVAEVRFFGLVPVTGSVDADGTLKYLPETGEFQFTDIQVRKFNLKGLPQSQFDEVTAAIGTQIVGALGGLKVYKFNPDDAKERAAKAVLRGIRVTDDGIVAKLGFK